MSGLPPVGRTAAIAVAIGINYGYFSPGCTCSAAHPETRGRTLEEIHEYCQNGRTWAS